MARKRGGGLRLLAGGAAVLTALGGGLYLKGEGQKTDAAQVEMAGWMQKNGAKAAVGQLAADACVGVSLPVFGLGEYHTSALDGNQDTHEPEGVDVFDAGKGSRKAAVYDYRFGPGEEGTVRLAIGVPQAEAAGVAAVAAQVCRTDKNGGDRSASFEVRMPEAVSTDWTVLRMAQLPSSPSAPHS